MRAKRQSHPFRSRCMRVCESHSLLRFHSLPCHVKVQGMPPWGCQCQCRCGCQRCVHPQAQTPTFASRTSHDLVSADTNGHMDMKSIQRMPPMLRPPMQMPPMPSLHWIGRSYHDIFLWWVSYLMMPLMGQRLESFADKSVNFFTTILFTSASVRKI